jgi:hypothetical protein
MTPTRSGTGSRPGRLAALALLGLLIPLAGPGTVAAQEIDFSAQVRPRFEARTPVDGKWDYFTNMRTRVGLAATFDRGVSLFAQLQDVRYWGGEDGTTDFSAEGFDLHQGYLTAAFDGAVEGYFRAGRQEVNYGGQRLVGALDWLQQARAFDGGVLVLETDGGHTLDLMASKISENTAQNRDVDAEFLAAYGVLALGGAGDLDLYWLFNRDSRDDSEQTEEHTMGARWVADLGGALLRFEGSYQVGRRAGEDADAFMFGARFGGDFGDTGFGGNLWYDYLSGDASLDDGTAGTFNTLFATNHKFYGFYDLFLNIPKNTGRHGLQDYALKTWYRPGGSWGLGLDLHHFRVAEQRTLSDAAFGNELDITLLYRYTSNAQVLAGYSYVGAGNALKEIERLTEDGQFLYAMLNVSF